jgi:hypothetical protein
MEEIVVYTCIAGPYDRLSEAHEERGVRHVCFTDQKGEVPGPWEKRELRTPPTIRTGRLINRYHKMRSHSLFPNHKYSIYIDGNATYGAPYRTIIDALAEAELGLAAFAHPRNPHTLSDEVAACLRTGKFTRGDRAALDAQLSFYEREGMPSTPRIPAGYFLARNHENQRLATSMQLWWEQLVKFTTRDQISLPYVLWKSGLPWGFVDSLVPNSASILTRRAHKRSLTQRVLRRLQRLVDRPPRASSSWPGPA